MNYEILKALVEIGYSTHQIAKKFDCSQTKVIYWLNKHNLHTKYKYKKVKKCLFCESPLKRKVNNYCDNACFVKHHKEKKIEAWKNGSHPGHIGKSCSIAPFVRRYLLDKYDNKCTECKWSGINPVSKKTTLQIDHIDGNPFNSSENNLRILCPNCHSLTPTFGRLNKLGRRKLGLRG